MQLPNRSAAWRTAACVLLLPVCLCAGGAQMAGVPAARLMERGAAMTLRGGADAGKTYQMKLQRSYSMNSVIPVADHPTTMLASTSSFDRKGAKRLDLQMETSWQKEDATIEVTVRSKYGGDILKTGESDLVMHWGVSTANEDPEKVDIEQVRLPPNPGYLPPYPRISGDSRRNPGGCVPFFNLSPSFLAPGTPRASHPRAGPAPPPRGGRLYAKIGTQVPKYFPLCQNLFHPSWACVAPGNAVARHASCDSRQTARPVASPNTHHPHALGGG